MAAGARPSDILPDASGPRPVVVVTGALAPYTHVLYEGLAERLAGRDGRALHVLSCTPRERARQWVMPPPRLYRHAVLPGLRWHRSSIRNLYVTPAVVPRLAIQKNAYPMIRTIELVEPEVSRTLVLVTRRAAQLSPAARALYDMIVEEGATLAR